jgi:hypothetical protein
MTPGLRLRQVRERLGLTYRDVERCSFDWRRSGAALISCCTSVA